MPKPYYSDKWVTIYHGDCREILPQLDCSDLLCTDPPYNVKINYGNYKDNLRPEEYKQFISWLIEQSNILCKGNMSIVLGSKMLKNWWNFIPEAKLIIVRMGAISNNKIKNLSLQYHAVLTTVKSNICMPDLWEDIRWPGEGYYFNEDRYGHPAMTPLKLAQRLINLFSPPYGVVIDPFVGCGTMAYAAKSQNRKFIGIDNYEPYLEIAAKRCSQEVMELGI